jgi:RNA polymerase sigma-70 factor (ECF subfamily)
MTQHCACETWPVAGAISTVSSAVVAAGLSPLSAPASAVPQVAPDPESSIALVERLQQGDADAMDRLFARYLRPLKRWAHNRLPPYARSLSDTQDVVQDGIVRVLANLGTFRPQRTGSFHKYLRMAVMSQVLDEIRRAGRRPAGVELDHDLPSNLPSPYDIAVKGEDREIYEQALDTLSDDDRDLVIGRLEWGLSYSELAEALKRPSVDAARVAARRAVVKLAEVMHRLRKGRGD